MYLPTFAALSVAERRALCLLRAAKEASVQSLLACCFWMRGPKCFRPKCQIPNRRTLSFIECLKAAVFGRTGPVFKSAFQLVSRFSTPKTPRHILKQWHLWDGSLVCCSSADVLGSEGRKMFPPDVIEGLCGFQCSSDQGIGGPWIDARDWLAG